MGPIYYIGLDVHMFVPVLRAGAPSQLVILLIQVSSAPWTKLDFHPAIGEIQWFFSFRTKL